MENNIMYYRNNQIEYISYENSVQSYPVHTHASHIMFGYVTDGAVRIICNGEEFVYQAGGYFCILPDTPHAVEPVNDIAYSMLTVCMPVGNMPEELGKSKTSYSRRLKERILNTPENTFLIEDMAQSIAVSPYHMIRQFKAACGLTPHQFQIQCRVRKAQRLLEEGKSVTEAAYATGFCDQSHFDRCFKRIVRLTPNAYRQSVRQNG